MHIGSAPFRLLRAGVFGVACMAVSALLHTAAGGHVHSGTELIALAGALAVLAFTVGGRQRGFPVILASCALAQIALHCHFSVDRSAPLGFDPVHLVPSPGMIAAHALAIAVSAVWLRRGEAALADFLDLLRAAFAALTLPRLPDGVAPLSNRVYHRPARLGLPGPRSTALVGTRSLRGPPGRTAFSG